MQLLFKNLCKKKKRFADFPVSINKVTKKQSYNKESKENYAHPYL